MSVGVVKRLALRRIEARPIKRSASATVGAPDAASGSSLPRVHRDTRLTG
jgi:hypothetical protein